MCQKSSLTVALRPTLSLSLAAALVGATLALAMSAAADDVSAQAGTCDNCYMGIGFQGAAVR